MNILWHLISWIFTVNIIFRSAGNWYEDALIPKGNEGLGQDRDDRFWKPLNLAMVSEGSDFLPTTLSTGQLPIIECCERKSNFKCCMKILISRL